MNSSNGSDSILLSMLSGGLLNEKFVGIPQGQALPLAQQQFVD